MRSESELYQIVTGSWYEDCVAAHPHVAIVEQALPSGPQGERSIHRRASEMLQRRRWHVACAAFSSRRDSSLFTVWCLEHQFEPATGRSFERFHSWAEKLRRMPLAWRRRVAALEHDTQQVKRDYAYYRRVANLCWHEFAHHTLTTTPGMACWPEAAALWDLARLPQAEARAIAQALRQQLLANTPQLEYKAALSS